MECEFCKNKFVSKSNLYSHQKTAKFCLKIQGKLVETNFNCKYCNKSLTQRSSLDDHLNVCKEKKKQIQDDKEKEQTLIVKKLETELSKVKRTEQRNYQDKIEEKEKYYREKIEEKEKYYREKIEEKEKHYKEKIEGKEAYFETTLKEKNEYIAKLEARLDKFESTVVNLAAEPKTTTKTTTNNVVVNNHTLNLSQEHVSKVLDEHFTKEVAAGGQKGLAKMVHEKMLTGPDGKPTYVCVDSSRHTFEFTNNDGDVERDVKAKKLTKALINSKIQQKAAEVGNQIWTKADGHVDSTLYEYCSPKVMELACFEKDDSKFRSELSALTS
jgi:hypothetical protein